MEANLNKKKTSRYYLLRLLQIIGIAVLVFFFFNLGIGKVWSYFQKIAFIWLPLIILFGFANIAIRAFIWKYVVDVIAKKKISFYFSILSIVAGISSGSIMPGRADIAKPLMLKTEYNIPLTESISAMFVERFFYIVSLIILFFVSLSYFVGNVSHIFNTTLIGMTIIIILFFGILVYFPERIFTIIEKIILKLPTPKKEKILELMGYFLSNFKRIKSRKVVSLALLLTITSLIIELIRMYWIFWLMDIDLSIQLVAFSFFASMLFSLVTMIPGGVGVYETSQSEIIYNIDPSADIVLVKSGILFVRIVYYYLVILLGSFILLFLDKGIYKGKKMNNITPERR